MIKTVIGCCRVSLMSRDGESQLIRTLLESYSVGLRPVMILSLIPDRFATYEMCSAARSIRDGMSAAESGKEIGTKSIYVQMMYTKQRCV